METELKVENNAKKSDSIKSIFQGLTFILVFYLLVLLGFPGSSSSSSLLSLPSSNAKQQEMELHEPKILSRKRRFLAFPYGSSFSATICTTIGMYGNPNYNWISYALNFGVSYNLPNETWVVDAAHGFGNLKSNDGTSTGTGSTGAELIEKRRTPENCYLILRMGFDGQQCILRALCEASKLFSDLKGTMVEEMVKTIFSYPGRRRYVKDELIDTERYKDFTYQRAFQRGHAIEYISDCINFYPNCTFSLIDLAFGKYSVRPTTLMKKNNYSFM
ncbi:uncharacterized protein LOC129618516 [Condylostylus longicornis]|uniref:uncharacterized protein LOC129618516 n=1 Tax=Condylostylus longicornis TaxID=2530218 RepID=UPI00244DC37F|nr:uncharacterized protein LOC129618516 [Condylostylus longicornis]